VDGSGLAGAYFTCSAARNAEPVDPAIKTTHLGQRMVECVVLTGTKPNRWLLRPIAKVAALALANKIARLAWAMMKGDHYRGTRRTRGMKDIAPRHPA
jgi:hypothetical protein